ncbi:hypothetical protein ACFE04_023479 [Oxalis oulophora]
MKAGKNNTMKLIVKLLENLEGFSCQQNSYGDLISKCEKLKDQKSFTIFKGYEEKAIFGMERENNESKRSGVETDQDKGKYLQATDSSIRRNQEVKDVQKHNDIKSCCNSEKMLRAVMVLCCDKVKGLLEKADINSPYAAFYFACSVEML